MKSCLFVKLPSTKKCAAVVLHSAVAKVSVECRDCNNERHREIDFTILTQ